MNDKTEPQSPRQLWDAWSQLWNGDYAIAGDIVSANVRVHIPQYGMPDPETISGSRQLVAWIAAFRSSFDTDARILGELGPFIVDDYAIGRWIFHGTWQGGRPDTATAPAGTPVTFRGVDILRFESGRIAEYWLSDDQLDLYAQLGAVPQSQPDEPSDLQPAQQTPERLRQRLSDLSPEAGRAAVLALVLDTAAGVLERDAVRTASGDESFLALGLDSLTAVELRTRLGQMCGLALPSTMVFDYPTPQALADHLRTALSQQHGDTAGAALTALCQLESAVAGLVGQDEMRAQLTRRLTALLVQLAPTPDAPGDSDLDLATPEKMFAYLDQKLGPLSTAPNRSPTS
ncbi:MAG: phosphopantetheine-binding protein [Pseudonocardiaceae bacterium]